MPMSSLLLLFIDYHVLPSLNKVTYCRYAPEIHITIKYEYVFNKWARFDGNYRSLTLTNESPFPQEPKEKKKIICI